MKIRLNKKYIAYLLVIVLFIQLLPARMVLANEKTKVGNWSEYTLLSTSDSTLEISTSEMQMKGDIHSNGIFKFSGSKLNINGKCETKDKIDASGSIINIDNKIEGTENIKVPDLSGGIKQKISNNADVIDGNKQLNNKTIKVDKPIIVHGEMQISGSSLNIKSYIMADKDINIKATSLNQDVSEKLVICSTNGNININTTKANFNGIIYAPKGTVTINSSNFNLNGRIIADKIIYRGSLLNVTSNNDDLSLIGGNINLEDEDNDGLPDIYENDILISAMLQNGVQLHHPLANEDYDKDGLTNLEEYKLGTNPGSADTDEDGISDYDEVNKYHTNPKLYDTDGDGMGDGTEIKNGLNPLVKDSDGNGVIDSEEILTQKLIDSKYNGLDISKSLVTPQLTIKGKGDFSKEITIKDVSENKKFTNIHSMVGHPFEIEHKDSLKFDSAELTFKIGDNVLKSHKIKNLKLAYYDTEKNKIEILESKVDEENNTVSSVVNHFSYYFVIDEEDYYYDIDVLNSNSKIETGKADVVFVIDTTGSMSNAISNVKNNINAVVEELKKKKVDIRLGLVGFKDITTDGLYSTKDYGWFTNVDDFKNSVSDLYADGGGDWEESSVDGLDVARNKNFRESVSKYIILITDAGYKEGTANDPSITMDKEIKLLKENNISVSVITSSSAKKYYEKLYTETNGIIADIYDVFASILHPLIEKMSSLSNDGAWIRLSNGSIVHLAKDPELGDYSVDTDKDGVPDLIELNRQEEIYYGGSGNKSYKCWTFNSNPAVKDTDGDSLDDSKDINPTKYDICISEKNNNNITFNNGDKWIMFGHDIYSFRSDIAKITRGIKSEDDYETFTHSDMYKNLQKLLENRKTSWSKEEAAIIATFDINGVRDYLTVQNKAIVNDVFKILTGKNPHYYKHEWFNGWVDKGETPIEESWIDFFTGDVKTDAEGTLTIYYSIDLNKVLKDVAFAGIIIGASYLAAGEIALLAEGIEAFGAWNALTMYSNGGSTLLQNNINYLKNIEDAIPTSEILYFRGTTVGYKGSSGLQRVRITPVSTDPVVSTVFATEANNYGNGVLYIATKTDLEGIVIEEGNVISVLEKEVGINLLPEEFAKKASINLTPEQSRSILRSMGIDLPSIISDKTQLSYVLHNTPRLSNEQLIEYYKKVLELVGD
ncbi:von Willebrand factor type A domain-containing protein [Clostridium cavendishii DSM 21758]|uniref:von Willebrand factor type A domain-containing protein n=1 Tax=Clostridium cavendishii DSM 21758 TaxID=1121302 RepID=A0A1M6LQW9_9CLOT|nr:vWA domain-containing protein [Clostridium cavendishii]SHJ73597.1 von Willebrand factor type A domain-containing protein [Clostridium cavendishii DSM 21758]